MTECALCLDPIASTQPWGAVIGCGHPFHRECWDRFIANNRNAKCPLCNGEVQGFQPVCGVDLGRGNDGDDLLLQDYALRFGTFLLSCLKQLQNVLENASVVVWKKSATVDGVYLASSAICFCGAVMASLSDPILLPDFRPLMVWLMVWYFCLWIPVVSYFHYRNDMIIVGFGAQIFFHILTNMTNNPDINSDQLGHLATNNPDINSDQLVTWYLVVWMSVTEILFCVLGHACVLLGLSRFVARMKLLGIPSLFLVVYVGLLMVNHLVVFSNIL